MSEIIWPEKITPADLQAKLDMQHPNSCVEFLPNREYPAPLTIRTPITLDGRGSTLWAFKGPVIRVMAPICLRNLRLEVTGDQLKLNSEEECAIVVEPGINITLENVEVRGQVRGLSSEEGLWLYPHFISLGHLKHKSNHERIARIFVPVDCRLDSHISGIEVKPIQLKAGLNEIRLHIEQLSCDTLLDGYFLLSTSVLRRRITVTAFIGDSETTEVINGQVIWEPKVLPFEEPNLIESRKSSLLPKPLTNSVTTLINPIISSKDNIASAVCSSTPTPTPTATATANEILDKSRLRRNQVPTQLFSEESKSKKSSILKSPSIPIIESQPLKNQIPNPYFFGVEKPTSLINDTSSEVEKDIVLPTKKTNSSPLNKSPIVGNLFNEK